MKKLILPTVMAILLTLSSCEAPKELDTPTSLPADSETVGAELVIDEKVVSLLNEITFTDGHVPTVCRSLFDYVVSDDALYLYRDGDQLYHLNPATGFLTGVCDDPLCEHKSVLCPNNRYMIFSAVGYNKRIYVSGQQIITSGKDMRYEDFIGYYDTESAQYVVLDSWETIMGYGDSASIQIYDNALYYLKKVSDSSNQLWKSDLNRKNTAERVDNLENEFLMGFIIKDGTIYYTDNAQSAIYSVNLDFQNQQVLTSETIPNFAIMDDDLICTNQGKYNLMHVEWDIEEYVPSDTPFEIYTVPMADPVQKTTIASHIQGVGCLKIDHGFITATPDRPTYLGMEIKNGKKKYYVNKNSGCILVGRDLNTPLQLVDLSDGIGIDYSASGIYYIDESVCIVYFQGDYKSEEFEGTYLITDYNTDNRAFHRLNFEA